MEDHSQSEALVALSVDDVIITDELPRRPSRSPDYAAENRALSALAEGLTADPNWVMQKVPELILQLCHADSAGVSVLEDEGGEEIFRWHAAAGAFAHNIRGTMPRAASPCGTVVTRNCVMLFKEAGRFFPALRSVEPRVYETLLTPWEVNGRVTGTVWAVKHTPEGGFDAEDARLLMSLARFAGVAYSFIERARHASEERRAAVNLMEDAINARQETERANVALRESEERNRLILEGALDYAIFTIDPEGLITSWTPGAEAVFGWKVEEAIGRSVEITFTPEDVAAGAPAWERAAADEQGAAPDVRWHLRRDTWRVFIEGVMRPLRDDDGAVRGFLKIGRDITARRRAEEALRRAHEELEEHVRERTLELAEANVSLQQEVRERASAEERVRQLLRQLVTVQEEERRRIARELHDTLGQQLTALHLSIDLIKAESEGGARLREYIGRTQGILDQLDTDVDFLAWELRPAALDQLGLDAALQTFVQEWSEHFGVEAHYHGLWPDATRLAPEVKTNLYRILQEALQNIHKHAGATSVSVQLQQREGRAVLVVEDNGRGYDPEAEVSSGGDKGMGVTNMRERAALVGGELEVESEPGAGTTIYVRVPVEGPAENGEAA